METESVRILRQREAEISSRLAAMRSELAPLEKELQQVRKGLFAMVGEIVPAKGLFATEQAVAHHRRNANPDIAKLTLKQLIVKALGEHLSNGATALELLDFFKRQWGREIMRTSLSPQLSRLKSEHTIELRGKVWHLAGKENEPPEGKPKDGSETAQDALTKEATE